MSGNRMKSLQFGISYGMGVPSISPRSRSKHPLIGSEIIELHKRTYPRFWPVARTVRSIQRCTTARWKCMHGWPLHI